METLALEPPKDILQIGQVRQLQTIDELMAWQRWKYPQEELRVSEMALQVKQREYQQSLARSGVIGTGQSSRDPSIFAITEGQNIRSAGSAYKLTTFGRDSHFPTRTPYCRIDDALTDSRYRNRGLNTSVTLARIEWARTQQLPWVQTSIHMSRPASIQAKLKVGFIIYDLADEFVRVMYPLHQSATNKQGIHANFDEHDGELVRIEDLLDLQSTLSSHFGIVSDISNPEAGLFVRMIPRDFSGSREI